MARLMFPDLPPGPLRELMEALHQLHARAGWPSVRTIAKDLQLSHFTVHQLFLSVELPKPTILLPIVEYMAELAPRADVDEWCDRIDNLWTQAERYDALRPPLRGVVQDPGRSVPRNYGGAEAITRPPATMKNSDLSRPVSQPASGHQPPILPDLDNSHAVFIAVSAYTNTKLSQLPGVSEEAEALHGLLTDPENPVFLPENTTLLTNPCTQQDVFQAIHQATTNAKDTTFVYLSAHGLLSNRGSLLLALRDSEPDTDYTSISYDTIRDMMASGPSNRSVVILDACYSGRADRQPMGTLTGLSVIPSTYILTSSGANYISYTQNGSPWFTRSLVEIMRDGIPDGPPLLDMRAIHQELGRRAQTEDFPSPVLYETVGDRPLALGWNRAGPQKRRKRTSQINASSTRILERRIRPRIAAEIEKC